MKAKFLKTVGIALTAVMCMGMTVFAAPSQEAPTYVVKSITTATDANGNAVEAKISTTFSADDQKAVDTLKTEEGLKAAMGADFNKNMVVASVIDVSVPDDAAYPVTLTFSMSGITANSKVQILHWNGSAWEKIATTVSDGAVTGKFDKLSPVAFVVDKTTVSGGTTSPKTSAGSTAGIALLGICAVVAVCGMKKKAAVR